MWVRESFDGGAVFQKKGVGTRRCIPPATQATYRRTSKQWDWLSGEDSKREWCLCRKTVD